MSMKTNLSIQQQEKALIVLIEDAKILGFNMNLTQKYHRQLKDIQDEIQRDKDKRTQFKLDIIERGLKIKC